MGKKEPLVLLVLHKGKVYQPVLTQDFDCISICDLSDDCNNVGGISCYDGSGNCKDIRWNTILDGENSHMGIYWKERKEVVNET